MLDCGSQLEARHILRTAAQRARPAFLVMSTPDAAQHSARLPLSDPISHRTPSLQPIRMRHSTLPHRLCGLSKRCECRGGGNDSCWTGLKEVRKVQWNRRKEEMGSRLGEAGVWEVEIRVADGPGTIDFALSRMRGNRAKVKLEYVDALSWMPRAGGLAEIPPCKITCTSTRWILPSCKITW